MLIAGLGNPGIRYADTFHNIGYGVVERLAEILGKKIIRPECFSLTAVKSAGGEKIILAKPLTYMNSSGDAVRGLVKKYGQTFDDVIIVYDDADLPKFTVRARKFGSAGTHNGMRDVVEKLGTTEFKRIRIGIGREEGDLKEYVLGKINPKDGETFGKVFTAVAEALEKYISDRDFEELMRTCNSAGFGE